MDESESVVGGPLLVAQSVNPEGGNLTMRMRTSLWLLAASGTVVSAACSSAPRSPSESGAESAALTAAADAGAASSSGKSDGDTRTPIKHVLVIIGENRSFDHVFATYKPK